MVPGRREVLERDDAEGLSAFPDHGEAVDEMLAHQPLRLLDVCQRVHRDGIARAHLIDFGDLRIASGRYDAHRDVSVCEHAGDPTLVVHHDDVTDVVVSHDVRGGGDGGAERNDERGSGTNLSDKSHANLPVAGGVPLGPGDQTSPGFGSWAVNGRSSGLRPNCSARNLPFVNSLSVSARLTASATSFICSTSTSS